MISTPFMLEGGYKNCEFTIYIIGRKIDGKHRDYLAIGLDRESDKI